MKFDVYGPYEIFTTENKIVDSSTIQKFWRKIAVENEDLENAIGCYVFAIKASQGAKPYYIGKTEKSFKEEVFTYDKINKYNETLVSRNAGIPGLFLVPLLTPQGKISTTKQASPETRELESILIGMGIKRNSDLLNSHKTKILREMEVAGFIKPTEGGKKLARRQHNGKKRWKRAAGLRNVFDI